MSETDDIPTITEVKRSKFIALLPLWIWLLLAIPLGAYDIHRRLAATTTIGFLLGIEGKPLPRSVIPSVKLDGKPFVPGRTVRLGKRELSIEAPSLEPFRRQISIGYGSNHLGLINLERSKGTLMVIANPAPREIMTTGDGFRQTSTNAPSEFGPVPVGSYTVTADFGRFQIKKSAEVRRNRETRLEIMPEVGSLMLQSDPPNATFTLRSRNDSSIMEAGSTPAEFHALPAGPYALGGLHGKLVQNRDLELQAGVTNQVTIVFEYADITIRTTPEGATVRQDGREVGRTPITLNELNPGQHTLRLEHPGYVPLTIPVTLANRASAVITTNFVSAQYAPAMLRARRLSSGFRPDYIAALAALEEALEAKPGDTDATELKAQLENAHRVEMAKAAEEKQREAIETRKRQLADAFNQATSSMQDNRLFEAHRWTFQAKEAEVLAALQRISTERDSGWKLTGQPNARQAVRVLNMEATRSVLESGKCNAAFALTETSPGEVEIIAKFFDYYGSKIANLLGISSSSSDWVPVHPSQSRGRSREEIEKRRQTVPLSFKNKLLEELQSQ